MASVTINIPNIGNVVAENAATEETLLKILKAMEKNGAPGAGGGDAKKVQDDLNKQKKAETDASKNQTTALKDSTKETADAEKKTSAFGNAVSTARTGMGELGKAAISLTAQFAKQYDEIAKNPIGAASGMINTGIDLAAKGAKATTGLIGAIPFVGQGLKQAADAAVEFAATLAKTANDIMAAEFKKSVEQLTQYTKAGASFAGGMIEMRTVAHDAGVSMETMSKAASASTESFRLMGVTQGEGVKALSKSMKAAGDVVGKSGGSLRNEMLALGYSYEEQGVVMAQYMAQQKATGQLEKMTAEDIAKGTREYATNLKVISDITGQDAKKLMEKARAESMRGALQGKLDADQQQAFKDAHATLMQLGPEAGPKMQQALMQMLAGGTVTDPVIAGNAAAMEHIRKMAEGVTAGNKDMIQQTAQANGEFVKKQKEAGETATSTAAVMSSSFAGTGKDMATFQDSVRGLQIDPNTGKISKEAAEAQATATDGLTKGYQEVTAAGNKLAMTMERLASDNLPAYADLLGTTMKKAIEAFEYVANKLRKDTGEEKPLTKEQKEVRKWKEEGPGGTRTDTGMEFGATGLSGAFGGIFSGPTTGYPVTMHGTEAIVPLGGSSSMASKLSELPDAMAKGDTGGTMEQIASTFKNMMSSTPAASSSTSDLSMTMQSLLDKQDEILRVLTDNRDYTQQLMHNLT